MSQIQVRKCADNNDLEGILDLQRSNLKTSISNVEMKQEGFVTLEHSFDLLKEMNQPYPHIVAESKGRIIGYCLAMEEKWKMEIPLLKPMFDQINKTIYSENIELSSCNYFVMGQVCIDKSFRGMGIFRKLYATLLNEMKGHFDYCITEISMKNKRSINAHLNCGFEKLKTYKTDQGNEWLIVLIKLN